MSQIAELFKQLTQQNLTKDLNRFQNQALILLNKINLLETQYNSKYSNDIIQRETIIQNKKDFLNGRKISDLNSSELKKYDALGNTRPLTNKLKKARDSLHITAVYNEAYQLLNDIGAYFYGKHWNYRITLMGASNTVYSFIMPISEFITNIKAIGVEGMKINTYNEIINKYKDFNEEQLRERGITRIKWDSDSYNPYNQQMFNNYKLGVSYGKAILIAGGKPPDSLGEYNMGQIIEGYMAYVDNPNNGSDNLKDLELITTISNTGQQRHLGIGTFEYLSSLFKQLSEQTNSEGFWTGPDTQYQEKGLGASVYQFSTIRNQLRKVHDLFYGLDFSSLEVEVANLTDDISNEINEKYQQILKKLVAGFNATVIAGGAESLNAEIRAML